MSSSLTVALFTGDWKVRRNQISGGAVEDPAVPAPRSGRVLISYAHDDPAHEAQVLQFYEFLRPHGVDALIDAEVAGRPQYWPDWMSAQIRQGGSGALISASRVSDVACGSLSGVAVKYPRTSGNLWPGVWISVSWTSACPHDHGLSGSDGRVEERLPGFAMAVSKVCPWWTVPSRSCRAGVASAW
jgi:hypothetical protein